MCIRDRRGRAHGDPPLLHRLEERGLRLRRRAVDLVGEDEVVEDGAGEEANASPHVAAWLLFFVEHVGARDVGREQVWRCV